MRGLRQGLILAGGFGTRIQEIANGKPKPLIPMQGRPLIDHSIELCIAFGVRRIAISVYHMRDQIKEYIGDGRRYGVDVVYLEEPKPLGTGGALRLHRSWFQGSFVMCNADELKDIDIERMFVMHRRNRAGATIALTRVEDPSAYGVVELEGSRILRFVEKPPRDQAPSNLINAGLYIMEPHVIDLLPDGFAMVEKNLFPQLAEKGELFGYPFRGQWFDTGTPERYHTAQSDWKGRSLRVSGITKTSQDV
jgi:mannose-1-phosphate guanylyltransferase